MTNPLESFSVTTDDFTEVPLVVESQSLDEVVSNEPATTLEVQPQQATPESLEDENARLRAENEHYRQIVAGRTPKGVTVMTAGQSQRVDDMIKQQPSEYFNKDFMVRPAGKKNARNR